MAMVVGAAAVLRLLGPPSDLTTLGGRVFAVLVAAALAVVAILARRSPGIAWFAAVSATGIAVVDLVGALRVAGLVADATSTPIGLVLAVAGLVAAAGVAVMDAARPRSRRATGLQSIVVVVAGAAWGAVALAGGWTLISGLVAVAPAPVAADDLAPIRLTGRLALFVVAFGLIVGTLRDVAPGVIRGWTRWRAVRSEEGRRSLIGELAAELLPWRAASESRGRESERARLAADLHALVLPDLRRAAAAVASTGAPDPAVAGVQRALDDVERLMHGRQSIVLEEFGLVAALEWLAERIEQQTRLRVDLQLDGQAVDRRDAVPPTVARAAFRIAMLALDNVDRHARATTAIVALRVDPGITRLVITDDGEVRPRPGDGGGRGLADMQREAAATGGALRVDTESRWTVEVTWPLA